ncbi:MAG: primosomal protein N', partial [Pirellulales bacterium]
EHQQNLFDALPPAWEQDDAHGQMVASVVFCEGPEQVFDYGVPEKLRETLRPGRRVRAPLGRGNRPLVGYCVALEHRDDERRKLKDISGVVDNHDLLSPSMLRLTQWIAEHYLCPWGQVLEAVVPAGVRSKAGTRNITLLSVPNRVAARLTQLDLPPKQAQALTCLAASDKPLSPVELARYAKCTLAPINALRKKGLIEAHSERVRSTTSAEPADDRRSDLDLNDDQQRALTAIEKAINSREHHTILLHGVTGSGKTEVYIRAIQEVVSFGRQAIVLVPEISLTPQTRARFRERFDRVAVLHSHMSDSERHHHWRDIATGQVQVIVGARSAVFAPTPHLGLIVVDEEHETSFKQESPPRYHAREVARRRALNESVPLVLGTATPSLESWQRARSGEYQHIELPGRINDRPMPAVVTIDMRNELEKRSAAGVLSRSLRTQMAQALQEGGQVILLLNRRGFSTHIQCTACGEVLNCPHCDIALTHHRKAETALCHYCDYSQRAPTHCPKCNTPGIRYGGTGTQRLEAEVRARFSDYPCIRMDTDAMQKPGSHERALAAFRDGEVRILLGTQMIAKGLDFPNVTLVGVVNADTALHLPDFRAAERTFQLVVQVAGRTGRGERGGRVMVQTFDPDHPAIQAAVHHHFKNFADYELPHRQEFGYPPFGNMIRLIIRGPSEETTEVFAQHLADTLRTDIAAVQGPEEDDTARILGPAPAPLNKLRGKFRFQIHLHARDGQLLRSAVQQLKEKTRPPEEIQWIADVDPESML